MTVRRRPRAPGRRRLRRLVAGDRVYAFVLLGVVAVLVAMATGPLQNYTAAADRVDSLAASRERLAEEVDSLQDRRERLHDLEEIELMARTELGMVRPGEVPFVVVTPEPELERLDPEAEQPPAAGGSWYRRLGRWLGGLVG